MTISIRVAAILFAALLGTTACTAKANPAAAMPEPAVAKVAITPPARTVIGADADTPSTDSPEAPTLFLVRPCGEAGIVTVSTPT